MPEIAAAGGALRNQLMACQVIWGFRHAFFGKIFWGCDKAAAVGGKLSVDKMVMVALRRDTDRQIKARLDHIIRNVIAL